MSLQRLFAALLFLGISIPAVHAQNWIPITSANMNTFVNGSVSENVPSSMDANIFIPGAPGVVTNVGGPSQSCLNNFDWSQHPPVLFSALPTGSGFFRDPTQYVITPGTQLMTGFKFTGTLSGVAGGNNGSTVIESVFMTTQPCFAGGLEFGFVYYPVYAVYQFYWQGHANCGSSPCVDPWGNSVPQTGNAINFNGPFNTALTFQVDVQPDPGSPSGYGFVVNVTNPANGQIVFNNGGYPIRPDSDYNIGDFWQCYNNNFCGVPGYMTATMYRKDVNGATTFYAIPPFYPEMSINSMYYTSQLLYFY